MNLAVRASALNSSFGKTEKYRNDVSPSVSVAEIRARDFDVAVYRQRWLSEHCGISDWQPIGRVISDLVFAMQPRQ
jgi:hypothetical protein